MAAENCLWGAPRIHGELLKLGITISERSVSRYLHGRPRTRPQTWRTFLANHFGQISALKFAATDDEDIVVDASDVSLHRAQSIDASGASIHEPTATSSRSRQRSSLDLSLEQHFLRDRTQTRESNGRDPPQGLHPVTRRPRRFTFVRGEMTIATDGRWVNARPRARLYEVCVTDSNIRLSMSLQVDISFGPQRVDVVNLHGFGILANHRRSFIGGCYASAVTAQVKAVVSRAASVGLRGRPSR